MTQPGPRSERFANGVLTHAALGRLQPGDPVTVGEERAGRTGAATYVGFYADDDLRTLLPLVVVEWPDGTREVASETALERTQ